MRSRLRERDAAADRKHAAAATMQASRPRIASHFARLRLTKRLQIRQDVVHVVIGVLAELIDVGLERIVDGELHLRVGHARYQPVESVSAIVNSSR